MAFMSQHQNDPIEQRVADIKKRIDNMRRQNGWWPYDKTKEDIIPPQPVISASDKLNSFREKLKPRK